MLCRYLSYLEDISIFQTKHTVFRSILRISDVQVPVSHDVVSALFTNLNPGNWTLVTNLEVLGVSPCWPKRASTGFFWWKVLEPVVTSVEITFLLSYCHQ